MKHLDPRLANQRTCATRGRDAGQQVDTIRPARGTPARAATQSQMQQSTSIATRTHGAKRKSSAQLMPGSPLVSKRRSIQGPSTKQAQVAVNAPAPVPVDRPQLDVANARRDVLEPQPDMMARCTPEEQAKNWDAALVAEFRAHIDQKIQFLHRHLEWDRETFNRQFEIDSRRLEWEKQMYDRQLHLGNPQYEREKEALERRLNADQRRFERRKERYERDRETYEQDRRWRLDRVLAAEQRLPASFQLMCWGFRRLMSRSTFTPDIAPLLRSKESWGRVSRRKRRNVVSAVLLDDPPEPAGPTFADGRRLAIHSGTQTRSRMDRDDEEEEGPWTFAEAFQSYVDQKGEFYSRHSAWEAEKFRRQQALLDRRSDWESEKFERKLKADREESERRRRELDRRMQADREELDRQLQAQRASVQQELLEIRRQWETCRAQTNII
ncbi:hypothetical protein PtA15_8A178 [Puccinia triticina]|uniref:Uncharacterized protein n=1 Tax=Puccinia triticina TaxID=208348 RepID=A0ABY7CQ02_9BASI|nr:uncharacterized protein PtA15_8A178 [Puccinia triticina]WAQ87274.1 hypothetical protein PtA15_8A178 [Puccinia triticina]